MASKREQNIQVAQSGELTAGAEQTRPGPVFTPLVDIFETAGALTVLADLPGVAADDLQVELEDGVLTITGSLEPSEENGEQSVLREFQTGTFFRQFRLAETIDQSRIDARLEDGVLRLGLPKVEAAKPRQIKIQT
jgi:HSP20 family molecular chaperone IbpA